MSSAERISQLRQRATGKWQIPLFLMGFGAFGLSLLFYQSPSDRMPFFELRAELGALISSGQYTVAIEQAGRLLQAPEKTEEELAPVHAALGRANMLQARESGVVQAGVGEAVIEHYSLAAAGEYVLDAVDHELVGLGHEWAGDVRSEVRHYDASLSLADAGGTLDLRWHVARLRIDALGVDISDMEDVIDGLTADAGGRQDVLLWSLKMKVPFLCASSRCDEAELQLDAFRDRLVDEDGRRWHEYYSAYVDFGMGRNTNAESRLRLLRDSLGLRDELYAACGWLLGKVVLGGGDPERPMEAMSFFRDVTSHVSWSEYAGAGSLGLGEASVLLEQYDAGLSHYRDAIKAMRQFPHSRMLDPLALETSLLVSADRLRIKGAIAAALSFSELALLVRDDGSASRRVMLLERVGGLRAALARKKRSEAVMLRSEDPDGRQSSGEEPSASVMASENLEREARSLFLGASSSYRTVASLISQEEGESSKSFWHAALLCQESGDTKATVEIMQAFTFRHSSSEMIPRALRFLGRALQESGRYADAIEVFQENQRRFPRTPDAGSSLIPLAECYIDLGKQYADRAEQTLRIILETSEVFTPAAPEFADALFLLGDLLNRTAAFERAIPVLEEALVRFPSDSRTSRARFLLGDCYRQSGLALEEASASASFSGERQKLSARRIERLRKASDLFERMVEEFERRGESGLEPLDKVYLRHARLYQADCYFELGEYAEALAHYERAAWVYKGSTTALACYVQTINSLVFMGNAAEAKSALRRAQYLVETLPKDAFGTTVEPETQEDWRKYFAWVEQTSLFQ